MRLEENIYHRLDKQKPHRSETEEMLGAEFGKASSAFGTDAPEYGGRRVILGRVCCAVLSLERPCSSSVTVVLCCVCVC